VRLDFAGGWTDVPPFSAREGGIVVNAAIELTAQVAVRLGGRLIRLVSETWARSSSAPTRAAWCSTAGSIS